jgi:cysteine dioxygenase
MDIFSQELDEETKRKKALEILPRYDLSQGDFKSYQFFEKGRYTRNLILENDLFTMILVCWDKNSGSAIHDHPCEGCYVMGVKGILEEIQYKRNEDESLVETKKIIINEGDTTWITDSIGYHLVRNPTCDRRAITLHIYQPPYKQNRVFKESGESMVCPSLFYSEGGIKVVDKCN